MTSKEYKELEERYKELWLKKTNLERELQEVTAEYFHVSHRLKNEPITD